MTEMIRFDPEAERASDLFLWFCNEMTDNGGNSYDAIQTIAETMDMNGRGQDYPLLMDAVGRYAETNLELLTLTTERRIHD